MRGYYVARPRMLDITADPNGELAVHGLVLVVPFLHKTPLGGGRIAREVISGRRQADGSLTRIETWGKQAVRFAYYPTTDLLEISFVRGEEPILAEDMPKLEGWLEGVLGYPAEKLLKVVQIGVNVDHRDLTLDGVKSITFQESQWVVRRLYQKRKGVVRMEGHLNAPLPPGLADLHSAIRVLIEGTPAAQMLAAARIELKLLREQAKLVAKQEELARRTQESIAPKRRVETPAEARESGYG